MFGCRSGTGQNNTYLLQRLECSQQLLWKIENFFCSVGGTLKAGYVTDVLCKTKKFAFFGGSQRQKQQLKQSIFFVAGRPRISFLLQKESRWCM